MTHRAATWRRTLGTLLGLGLACAALTPRPAAGASPCLYDDAFFGVLAERWNSCWLDGGARAVLSGYFYDALITETGPTLRFFHGHEVVFRQWLEMLDRSSFLERRGGACAVSDLPTVIDGLEEWAPEPGGDPNTYDVERRKIVDRLRTIQRARAKPVK